VGSSAGELYVPAEFAVGVYEDLVRVGADFGLVNAGYYATSRCGWKGRTGPSPRADAGR